MIPEISSPLRAGTRTWITLKWDKFALATSLLGCGTDASRADLLGADNKTIHNIKGGGPVSDKTVAKILTVLRANSDRLADQVRPDFDELFEVVIDEAA